MRQITMIAMAAIALAFAGAAKSNADDKGRFTVGVQGGMSDWDFDVIGASGFSGGLAARYTQRTRDNRFFMGVHGAWSFETAEWDSTIDGISASIGPDWSLDLLGVAGAGEPGVVAPYVAAGLPYTSGTGTIKTNSANLENSDSYLGYKIAAGVEFDIPARESITGLAQIEYADYFEADYDLTSLSFRVGILFGF